MNREEALNTWLPVVEMALVDANIPEAKEALDMAIKALEQDKWIPVSERYPTDTNKCYLVCYEDGCITIEYLYINDDECPFFSEMELGVVAWMPLPEPYKASQTGAKKEYKIKVITRGNCMICGKELT